MITTRTNTCISCIHDIASEKNISVSIIQFEDGELLFKIVDLENKINGRNYEYNFIII